MPPLVDAVSALRQHLAGRYDIERELGVGGMATVYLAHDVKHDRDVAVKVLKPELGAVLGAERFLSEIKVTANLQHPNLLPLFDSGDADGLLYYVMPYVQGETLRERLQREQQLPVDETIRLVTLMAGALDFAHARGVVHRDLKPENILLQAGQPVIADFGIALAVAHAGGERVTQTGLSLGTPQYMSPEQAAGDRAVDARSDQYSLASVTYEMLTGEAPHTGANAQVVIGRLMTETPRSIRNVRPAVSAGVDAAVQRALSKSPADRFSTCGDFSRALGLGTTPGTNSPPTPRLEHRSVIAALAGAIVVATVAGGFWWSARDSSPLLTIGRATQLTSDDGLEIQPALSPDGKLVAYSAGNSSRMRVFIRPAGGGRTVPLSDDSTSVETHAQWSPNGDSLLFLSRGGVFVSSALGGVSRAVVEPSPGLVVTSAMWSPDGTRIAYARGDSLFVLKSRDGKPILLATSSDLHSCNWSPKDLWIACVSGNSMNVTPGTAFANIAPSAIVLIPTTGGEVMRIAEPSAFNQSPIWSADGKRLYFISNRQGPRDVYTVRVSGSGRVQGEPTRLTTGLGAISISMSRDGRRMVYAAYSARANLWSQPIPSGPPSSAESAIPITTGSQVIESVHVSHDGHWLFFDSNINGNADLFRVATTGGQPEQLTSDSADEFAPDLSPDGRIIVYHVWRNGVRSIELKSLDGRPVEHLSKTTLLGVLPTWSPDGATIAFTQFPPPAIAIVRRGANGRWSSPKTIARGGGHPMWSPDGLRIAYAATTDATRIDSTMVVNLSGGTPKRLFQPGPSAPPSNSSALWSVDGKRIYLKAHDENGRTSFWSVNSDGGSPRLLVRFPSPDRQSSRADFAVDRTRFYFTIEDRQSDVFLAEMIDK